MIRGSMDDKPKPRTLEEMAAAAAEADAARGITCPKCEGTVLPVVFTRRLSAGVMRRVRECRVCHTRVECSERVVAVVRRHSKG